MLADARLETRLAAQLRDSAEAEASADGAVFDTAFHLLQADAPITITRGVRVLALHNGTATVRIEPENGKINPNMAQPRLLEALLFSCGTDRATATILADALVNWHEKPSQGAERLAPYKAAGLNYGPPSAPFETLDEIGLVLGMTPALVACLTPNLSLYQYGDPDPAVAPPLVLQALQDLENSAALADASELDRIGAVSITATVTLTTGARFVRHAVVRIGPGVDRQPYRILNWEAKPY